MDKEYKRQTKFRFPQKKVLLEINTEKKLLTFYKIVYLDIQKKKILMRNNII